jgi:hypothetical protein
VYDERLYDWINEEIRERYGAHGSVDSKDGRIVGDDQDKNAERGVREFVEVGKKCHSILDDCVG